MYEKGKYWASLKGSTGAGGGGSYTPVLERGCAGSYAAAAGRITVTLDKALAAEDRVAIATPRTANLVCQVIDTSATVITLQLVDSKGVVATHGAVDLLVLRIAEGANT